MKNSIFIILAVQFTALLLVSCNKDDDYEEFKRNGVYLNGYLHYELKSAFDGGAIADPSEGIFYRLHLYEDEYKVSPTWDKAAISISGFRYNDKTYNSWKECLETITIKELPDVGTIDINLDQGVYNGDNEQVKSVRINEFAYHPEWAFSTRAVFQPYFDITILLSNGTIVGIKYCGEVSFDNLTSVRRNLSCLFFTANSILTPWGDLSVPKIHLETLKYG